MEYETVIGLEVHAELATKSKIYCGCSTEFGGDVNTHTCPICTAAPGVLPVLNEKVVEYAILAGLATNCKITPVGKQDRKNYFYPDLPKAFQTSQYDLPICTGGYVKLASGKKIGLTRIHIEEDAGKLIHNTDGTTLVDYNRCGVPLIEIVSEPDMRSSDEAKEFLENLKAILEYTEVSDCKMEQGSLRCDVNVSVRPIGQQEFGTRCEMKNVNSFKAAVASIDYEVERQIDILEDGGTITQETRRWDEATGTTVSMRSKEDAQDYRYFPEPDLVNIVIDEEWINRVSENLPELPKARFDRYVGDYSLTAYDAELITNNKSMANYFDEVVSLGATPKNIANWLLSDVSKIMNEKELEDIPIPAKSLADMIIAIEKGEISGNAGKKILPKLFDGETDVTKIIDSLGLKQISDKSALEAIVKEVLTSNESAVNDYNSGKTNVLGFLVGQCMKASKGQGNPALFKEIILENI